MGTFKGDMEYMRRLVDQIKRRKQTGVFGEIVSRSDGSEGLRVIERFGVVDEDESKKGSE